MDLYGDKIWEVSTHFEALHFGISNGDGLFSQHATGKYSGKLYYGQWNYIILYDL